MASGHGNFRFPPYPEVRSTPILPEGKQPKCPAYGNHNQKARCLQADSDTRKSMLAGPRSEEVGFAHDSALEGSGFELPVPREIALWSRSGLALHLGSLALRRRGPDWNGPPTAEAWVSHREEIPRPHPSALTASPRSDVFGLGASLPTCCPAPTRAEKPGRCRRVSTGDIERIFRQA